MLLKVIRYHFSDQSTWRWPYTRWWKRQRRKWFFKVYILLVPFLVSVAQTISQIRSICEQKCYVRDSIELMVRCLGNNRNLSGPHDITISFVGQMNDFRCSKTDFRSIYQLSVVCVLGGVVESRHTDHPHHRYTCHHQESSHHSHAQRQADMVSAHPWRQRIW